MVTLIYTVNEWDRPLPITTGILLDGKPSVLGLDQTLVFASEFKYIL